jgi:hypothetical protein
MPTTLSYGFVKPQTGDKGSVFFPDLEDNIQQLNDHTHNGTNSAKLTAAAMTATTQAILSASWSLLGDGIYRQLVTVPASLTGNGGTYDNHAVQFRNTANGRMLYLSTEKASSTTYYLYINDNSIDVTAVYS